MIVAGIDPGLDGEFVVIDTSIVVTRCHRGHADGPRWQAAYLPGRPRSTANARPQPRLRRHRAGCQGVSSTLRTGFGHGMWIRILGELEISFVEVAPREWRGAAGLGEAAKDP